MDDGQRTSVTLKLLQALDRLLESYPDGVIACDGDGTLWSGDVGEDVFHYAVSHGVLSDDARAALQEQARLHAIESSGSATELSLRLFEAYRAGRYPEREVCAMMTWCYAGLTLEALAEHTRAALGQAFDARLNQQLAPVLEFARSRSVPVLVVSASPQPVVEHAAARWNIPPEQVIASRPEVDGTRILPRLAGPVPYAEIKPLALRNRVGGRGLLAAFGDNVFDIELLQAAQVGVAVRPKPALRSRLPELPGLLLLE
ncbi:MAG TPA: HAD family hydrolase [Polyangiaceae bacterium]|nr:HAD family hydrolase [Polyangiaceae bacterium]